MTTAAQSPAQQKFLTSINTIATAIGDKPLNASLADWLNAQYPANGKDFAALSDLIEQGDEEGWLCQREHGGVKFGRPVKPGAEAGRFSVDVVHMLPVKGPHHVHPQGEIGMIVPLEGSPHFDGMGPGWYVYEAGSAHHPTVTDGSVYVLYLLPEGAIEFTGK